MQNKKLRNSVLLVLALTLLSTLFIGNTFAKYVTTDTLNDTARVAKWGVSISVDGDNLFSEEYDKSAEVKSVKSLSGKVVAPGTGNSFSYSVTGTPEVKGEVTFTPVFTITEADWTVDIGDGEKFYFPLKLTFGSTIINGLSYTTHSALVAAINTAFAGEFAKIEFNPNQNLASIVESNAFEWEWPFSTSDNDVYDTALGNKLAAVNITMGLTITVTQVD